MTDYADLRTADDRRHYYAEQGYVVCRGLLSDDVCARAIDAFRREIRPHRGPLYRQASANPERHVLTEAGFMLNSILNPISVSGARFPGFRAISAEVLSSDALFEAAEELLGEPATIVQSMYFEGNPATWPHQDCYYLDSDREGTLLGAWIALEDIDERAGRFFVVPGSHRLDVGRNAGNLAIATNHDAYKRLIERVIADGDLEIRPPALNRGDVLLWNSRTIHGAQRPIDQSFSRNSFTAHFIASSTRLLQYQAFRVGIDPRRFNGHAIHLPKDQDRLSNRIRLAVEAALPWVFPRLKRFAIRAKLRAAGLV